ncbi:MAG TPA: hypothetical protein VNJ02_19285 [Vicinamibacterales bacterium]|nr:hypothetical protein [Vicinamibacterales bacterium]
MTDADLWSTWRLWMVVATVVVLIAATLLIVILMTARRILADAGRALAAVDAIKTQTQPIWALQDTNEVAENILTTVQSVEEKATLLAGALSRHEVKQ